MRVTIDQITFEEFKEATVAVRRLFHAKQKRIQRMSPATYASALVIGSIAYAVTSGWWPNLDAMPDIPPRFSISGHLIRDTQELMRRGDLA